MQASFTFIHIETSSNKPPAFPVEIYWGEIPDNTGIGHLVNPEGIQKWANWENEFFRKHLIADSDLHTYGAHPSVICDALTEALSGKIVYSKNPQQTHDLLTELFAAVDRQPCTMNLLDLDELFLQAISDSRVANKVEVLAQIKKQVAEEKSSYLCGGALEGPYYSEIWKRISLKPADEKIIALSESKIILLLLGACLFASAGAWMFFRDDAAIRASGPVRIPLVVHGFGLAAIILCALVVIVGLRKLFDSKPGLVFNSEGIVDNSSAFAAGLIPWSEITGAKIIEVRTKLLIIKVVNPDKYIEVGNALTRALNRKTAQTNGSPIAISSVTLKANLDELLVIFNEYFQRYGKPD